MGVISRRLVRIKDDWQVGGVDRTTDHVSNNSSATFSGVIDVELCGPINWSLDKRPMGIARCQYDWLMCLTVCSKHTKVTSASSASNLRRRMASRLAGADESTIRDRHALVRSWILE